MLVIESSTRPKLGWGEKGEGSVEGEEGGLYSKKVVKKIK